MYYGYGLDPTYVLVLLGVVICMIASSKMNATFQKYAKIRNRAGITGREAAEIILRRAGITDVYVEHISGSLTDHYDPSAKVVRLSDATYQSASVAALGVAAHECGHVMQHATGYVPLSLRTAFVPVANFGSKIAWPLIILGLIIPSNATTMLLMLGILAFSLSVLFQLITLPVEYNASSRALKILESDGLLAQDEIPHARKVLSAAALTYVAAAASALLQLLRLLMLANRRSR